MSYPGHRTVFWWFIAICVVIYALRDPSHSAAEIRGIFAWGQHAVDQFIIFVQDVFSGA